MIAPEPCAIMSGSTAFERMNGPWTLIANDRTQRFVG